MAPDKEDRIFVAFMAVCITVFGILAGMGLMVALVAIWKAGIVNFVVWTSIFTVIGLISRSVYHLFLRKGWF